MRKKRSFRHNKTKKHHNHDRNQQENGGDDGLYQRVLSLLYHHTIPLRNKDIFKELDLSLSQRKPLNKLLNRLSENGILTQQDGEGFSPGPNNGMAQGTLDQNVKGFGFVSGLIDKNDTATYSKDAFVAPPNMGNGHHGDTVLVRIFKVKKDGRLEGEILSVIQRGREQMAGFVTLQGEKAVVYPEDSRYPFSILLSRSLPADLKEGDAVIVKVREGEGDGLQEQGTLIEVLGDPDLVDVQMRMVIERHGLPHRFSEETETMVASISDKISPGRNRLDLRDIQHITIDGETAKDFDDAIAVIKTRKGFRLYVSIADVSHYVKPGTALDKDAYERGTSIYFPGRVIPMLPEKLSNGLCSLLPNEDRYAFTAIMDFDRKGHLHKKDFAKSIICSKHRFTYTTVSQIISDRDPVVRREHKEFLTPLKWAGELATELMHLREQRGSIGFTIPEPLMTLDEEGKISAISRSERNFAHKLIEEFMLAANEAVAETFTENKLHGLYRIHERPSPEKIKEFIEFSQSLGLTLPPPRQDPDWFGQVLSLVHDSPKEYVINNLLLRTMQQARYDTKNVGHFGLAATDYTHFTSPIRRYPDLSVHRTLQNYLQRHAATKIKKQIPGPDIKELGGILSDKERIAVKAEREMNDRLKVRFMHNKIGEEFEAIISGVTASTIFVELTDLFVSGGISLSSLKDDYYIFDAKHHRLRGKHSGRTFQMGELLQVVLLDVDLRRNHIHFGPLAD